ncbi:MAG: zincin-like metallopeptidase domain-containing protein [Hyphomicrobiaceae bacterium]
MTNTCFSFATAATTGARSHASVPEAIVATIKSGKLGSANLFGHDDPDVFEHLGPPPFDTEETTIYRIARRLGIAMSLGEGPPYSGTRIDVIHLPSPMYRYGGADLTNRQAFEPTGFHELIHWTDGATRLRRFKEWSRRIVTIEEIAAELGAAYLAADFAVTDEVSSRHAAYIAHHLPIVGIDVEAVYEAAPIAEAAVAFIHAELADAARRDAERRSARDVSCRYRMVRPSSASPVLEEYPKPKTRRALDFCRGCIFLISLVNFGCGGRI